jgi:hypothetical protein
MSYLHNDCGGEQYGPGNRLGIQINTLFQGHILLGSCRSAGIVIDLFDIRHSEREAACMFCVDSYDAAVSSRHRDGCQRCDQRRNNFALQ